MSVERQSKVQRRVARKRKTASRAKAAPHAERGASAQALAHRDALKPSGLFVGRALYERGPGEELTWDYGFDDHGWFVIPRAGEPFALPLTAELESSWELLTDRVRVYDNASGDHAGIPPELCPPGPCSL